MSEFTEKSLIKYNLLHNGDVAQLGECRVRNAKVGSSILLVSTTISRPDMLWPAAYYFSAGQPVIPPRNRQVRHTIRPSCRAHCTRGLICQRQAGIQDVFRHIAGDPARNFAIATKIENACGLCATSKVSDQAGKARNQYGPKCDPQVCGRTRRKP